MSLFVKVVIAVSAMISCIMGVIIAASFFLPITENIGNVSSNSDFLEYVTFVEWIFGGAMVTLVGSVVVWWFSAVSSDEYEEDWRYVR